MKKALARKTPIPQKRAPAPESLAWYREGWRKMARGVEVPESFLTGLAQLSYENKKMRERLSVLESAEVRRLLDPRARDEREDGRADRAREN